MKTKKLLLTGTLFALLACPAAGELFAQARPSGEAIFRHHWSPNDRRAPDGDGLGPLFNGTSCLQCHDQGGAGGGGNIQQNIDFVSNATDSFRATQELVDFHPGFLNDDGSPRSSIILHRFGLDFDYSHKRKELTGVDLTQGAENINPRHAIRDVQLNPVQPIESGSRIQLRRSQRNSTALFGAGLINQIPDDVILQEALRQRGNISGRPAVVGEGDAIQLGRFGWRGQTASIDDFVMDACAMELGLEVHAREQTPDPRKPRYRAPGVDLTAEEVQALTQFVKGLPQPRQIMPEDTAARKRVNEGERHFRNVGCTSCHEPNMGDVKGLYSDLLLHDMGPLLSDPVPATAGVELPILVSTLSRGRVELPRPSSGSYGGGGGPMFASAAGTTLVQEWRTPPLWGVGDSAPYMHDGRAATLVEAIALHGGEAQQSTTAFFNSPLEDRLKLVTFLQTLRAPRD